MHTGPSINDRSGNISDTEFVQTSVCKIYLKFSDKLVGLNKWDYLILGRQGSWFSIAKCETEIPIKRGSTSLFIERTKLPLTLAWVSTIHKVQGVSFEQDVIYFDLRKQKQFGPGQTYTAFSSLKTYDNLYYIGEFKKSVIKVHKDALLEYERLKQNELFSTIKRNNFSDSPLTILVLNVKSLSKHVDNVASDNRIINKFLTVLMQDHRQLFSKDNA